MMMMMIIKIIKTLNIFDRNCSQGRSGVFDVFNYHPEPTCWCHWIILFLMICVKCVYVCDKKPLPLRRTKAHLLCLNSIISELV